MPRRVESVELLELIVGPLLVRELRQEEFNHIGRSRIRDRVDHQAPAGRAGGVGAQPASRTGT